MPSSLLIRCNWLTMAVIMLFIASACRSKIQLDEINAPPEEVSYTGPVINSFNLEPLSSADANKPILLPGNTISFPYCDSVCTLLKINDSNVDNMTWAYEIAGKDIDTFFTIKRKENKNGKDSSNYFLLCTQKITASPVTATLHLFGKNPETQQNIALTTFVLKQQPLPLDSAQVEEVCCHSGTPPQPPATCPNASTAQNQQNKSVLSILNDNSSNGTTTPIYIKQTKNNNQSDKTPSDSLVFGKEGSGTKKVFLKIKTILPKNSQCRSRAINNTDRYATKDILWTASTYSAGDWLKIKGFSCVARNENNTQASVGVAGTKYTGYLEVEVSPNNNPDARIDGLIVLKVGNQGGRTTHKINVFQKGTRTSTSPSP